MRRTNLRNFFAGLAAWLSLAGSSSCVSSDDAPAGGRVEHPDPGMPKPLASKNGATPLAQASASSAPSEHPSSVAEVDEPPSGFQRSPLDEAIAKDKPARPWSKNIPKRNCIDDGECGDGFCDRGRCAAIWTWSATYGQRCENDQRCGYIPCVDGRCRSCVSEAECKRFDFQDAKCIPNPWVAGFNQCHGVIGSGGFTVVPGPPPERPKRE